MPNHDIVVIGGSAGSFETLTHICRKLSPDIPAAIFVVVHISPTSRSVLPELLSRAGRLSAVHPSDGDPIVAGKIYVAPPDLHLLIEEGRVCLRRGPYENRTRPAIDPLFRSAAVAYRSRVIGLVLSGLLDDGSAGLVAVKLCGGISVVQSPEDALWSEMPRNAIFKDHVDYQMPAAQLPALLQKLTREPAGPLAPIPPTIILEARIAGQEEPVATEPIQIGQPTSLTCPQCGGVLNEVMEEGSTRFRCQIGHGFTAEGLLAAQHDDLEHAMESAMRIHREREVLFRRMQHRSEDQALQHAAARWKSSADESEMAANLIQRALEKLRKPPTT